MEDSIEVMLQDYSSGYLRRHRDNHVLAVCSSALLAGFYGLWTMFVLPGFRKVPARLKVLAASSRGFHCTGFEINSILLAYSRARAHWRGVPHSHANFVNKDFWKTDLSGYSNVTAFLAPGVMEALEQKLLAELPDGARVVSCRFPFPRWPPSLTEGSGLNQVWAYDVITVRKPRPQPCHLHPS
ncbi:ATP synthase subunit C lysine N-methyltransferase isoform X1 [Conger conger]|uniref:ATP synthase subunit C lysine N-methyltransferase isoform X1 n=1 Tax=Conger conger TaxID=82655 RepID=UPI002A5AC37C|nr:ATP synthase subunit C lysine N-methyltransferase isoform X1 [Conger conger]